MKSWLIIILGLLGAWHFQDPASDSAFQSVFCPIMVGLFSMALLIKVVVALGFVGGGGNGDGGGFMGGGSDGGGCSGGGD